MKSRTSDQVIEDSRVQEEQNAVMTFRQALSAWGFYTEIPTTPSNTHTTYIHNSTDTGSEQKTPTLPQQPDPNSPAEKPVPTKTSALEYISQSLNKIPAAYVDVRIRVQKIYNNIRNGTYNNLELQEVNLERLVQEASYPKEGDRGPNANPPQQAGPRTPVERKPYDGPQLVYDPSVRGPGYGYNILHDKLLPYSPFYMDRNSIQVFRVGAANRIAYISHKFRHKQEYINHRLNTTRAAHYIPSSVFKANYLPGHGLKTNDVVEEHKDWLVHLESNISKLNLRSEFKDEVTRLVSNNGYSCNSADDWITFFRTHGTHVLMSAYSGGAIEFRPYGRTVWEIRQAYSPAQYLRTAKLGEKEFTFRAIGGNTSILVNNPPPKRSNIQTWSETVKVRPVWLLDDIKLIPIHTLFPYINSSRYTQRIAIKAYNAYLDGTLETCDSLKRCEPNLWLVNGKCICHAHQFPLDGKCLTVAQYACELDGWDDCGPNSYCVQTHPSDFQFGKCQCRGGFRESIRGFCHKSFGETCFGESEHECDSAGQIKCKIEFSRTNRTCQCVDFRQSYDHNQQQCLSGLNGPCGYINSYGKEHKLKCKDPLICNSETSTCY